MKRLWIIICALVLSPLGWAQSIPISGFVVDQYGSPVAGAQVFICSAAGSSGLPCTPPASIFQDYDLATPAPNPTQTDANGNFNVYVGPLAFPNTYVVNMVTPSGPTYTQLYPGPSCPLGGCTFTGPITGTLFNATASPYFEVNGTQLASTNLLDTANIAYLNAQNTFTGSKQTAPIWNATTGFQVGGVALASANLSDTANLAYLNLSNTFTGTTNTFKAVVGTTITGTTINATTGFQVGGVALSAANLSNGVSGTGAVCLASGSICSTSSSEYYQTVAANGVAQTQRPTLNFSPRFTLTDSASPAKTTVDLATSGVTAGSYTLVSIIVDAYGRITTATNGSIATSQKNCLSVACAGGSTYTTGVTYTNSSGVPVMEEVTYSTLAASECTGANSYITAYVNSSIVGAAGVSNECQGTNSTSFIVPPGSTFEVVYGTFGTAPSSWAISGWAEVSL